MVRLYGSYCVCVCVCALSIARQRRACGPPTFVSGVDIAPLLVLRTKPLKALYQQLLNPAPLSLSTRTFALNFTIVPVDTLKGAPLALAKPLVAGSRPACACILDDRTLPLSLQVSPSS